MSCMFTIIFTCSLPSSWFWRNRIWFFNFLENNEMFFIALPEWMSQLRTQQHYLQGFAEPDCPIIPLKFQSEQQMEFGQYSWLQKGAGFLLLKEINRCHVNFKFNLYPYKFFCKYMKTSDLYALKCSGTWKFVSFQIAVKGY